MNVIITGATGFLGHHVTEYFINKECNILGFGSEQFDLRNKSDCEFMIRQGFRVLGKIDCVVNLAANVGGIEYNINNPYSLYYDNLMINTNLIDVLTQYAEIKLIQIGTTCSYPAIPEIIPFVEGELFDGYPEESNAPYGLAKRMSLVQLQSAQKQFGMDWIYLIPANLYGPQDCFNKNKSHVIPALIRKFVDAKKDNNPVVEIWGDGNASRDFLYVEDAARAIYLAAKDKNHQLVLNIGSGEEITIAQLAYLIKDLTGYIGQIVWDEEKPAGQSVRVLDVSKAGKFLNWNATTDLREGLTKTIKWYEENYLEN